jgi:NCS2 family nucleobase:cation symporter-2
VSVGIGILPEFAEGMFERFPSSAQILLGSGITLAAASAFSLNLLFNHTRLGELARRSRESLPEPATSSAGDASVTVPV